MLVPPSASIPDTYCLFHGFRIVDVTISAQVKHTNPTGVSAGSVDASILFRLTGSHGRDGSFEAPSVFGIKIVQRRPLISDASCVRTRGPAILFSTVVSLVTHKQSETRTRIN